MRVCRDIPPECSHEGLQARAMNGVLIGRFAGRVEIAELINHHGGGLV
jgi:hypothetical protein